MSVLCLNIVRELEFCGVGNIKKYFCFELFEMIYENFLKKNKVCPFCNLKNSEVIRKNKFAVLTLAQAPYCRDHLIVTCRHHHLRLNLMSREEKEAVEKLIYYGMRKLHSKYKNVTVLYREGNLKEVGKSIAHLHYHLIPEMKVGAFGVHGRKIFSDRVFVGKVLKFKERFIKKN